MADILLKNRNDVDVAYKDVNYVNLRSVEGKTVRFNDGDIRTLNVSELPIENIDENAIYRIETIDEQGNIIVHFYSYKDGEWIKHGNKAPVLTELITTENGVYENPVIEEPPVIAIGETLTFKKHIQPEDIPSEVWGMFYEDANGEEWIVQNYLPDAYPYSVYDTTIRNTKTLIEYWGPKTAKVEVEVNSYTGVDGAGWYKLDMNTKSVTKLDTPPSLTIIEDSSFNDGYLQKMVKCFKGTSISADGWSKVAVDVQPVLGKLVISKNGVYENLMGYADGKISVGDKIKFKEKIVPADIPNKAYPTTGYVGCYKDLEGTYISINRVPEGYQYETNQDLHINFVYRGQLEYEYFGPKWALAKGMEEEGWYVRNDGGSYTKAVEPPSFTVLTLEIVNSTFFATTPLNSVTTIFDIYRPVDGWDKVTVDVPVNKSTVLTDLVVTESGFYEKTVVEEPPSMQVGDTITFKEVINENDIPLTFYNESMGNDVTFYDDGKNQCIFRGSCTPEGKYKYEIYVFDSSEFIGGYLSALSVQDYTGMFPEGAGWYDATGLQKIAPPSLTISKGLSETLRYGYLAKMSKCFVGTGNQVTVDGYHSVYVNVPIPEGYDLGELVATENGTYDNLVGYTGETPLIEIGETVEFKEVITIADVPDINGYTGYYSDENATRISIRRSLGEKNDIHVTYDINDGEEKFEYFGPKEASNYSYLDGAGWYRTSNGEEKKITAPPPLTILATEPINHSFFNARPLQDVAKIFKGPLKSIAGWDKVTVNVPASKPAVLTGLTITENGFYEKTLVEELPLACGETLVFKDIIDETDIPIEFRESSFTFYDDGQYGCYFSGISTDEGFYIVVYDTLGLGSNVEYVSDKLIKEHPDWYPDYDSAGWYDYKTGEKITPPTLTIGRDLSDSMRYGYLSKMIKCFVGTGNQVAADGYHSVLVNVPSDIITVEELPTENVDTTKIYKLTIDGQEVFGIPNNATIKRLVDGVWVEL